MTLKKFQSFRKSGCQENESCAEGKISNQSTGGHEVWQPLLPCPEGSAVHTQQRCCGWLSTSWTRQIDDYIAFTYYSDVIKYPQLDSKQIKWNSILDVFFKLVYCFSFPWLLKFAPAVYTWKSCYHPCPITELGYFCFFLSKSFRFLSATNKICHLA